MKGECNRTMATQTVPNQRTIKVKKEPTDKEHLYTTNNLEAVDEAARYLQSKAGFKLYYYIAKNQNNYEFALSSKDFCNWSGVSLRAYNTAFEELEKQGYLVLKEGTKTIYTFYDKSRNNIAEENRDTVIIQYNTQNDMMKQLGF